MTEQGKFPRESVTDQAFEEWLEDIKETHKCNLVTCKDGIFLPSDRHKNGNQTILSLI